MLTSFFWCLTMYRLPAQMELVKGHDEKIKKKDLNVW